MIPCEIYSSIEDWTILIVTSPAAAVEKYCDEYMSVCLSAKISPEPHVRSLRMCMLPMSVARSSPSTLTIGRIAYRREWGDGSAQRGRSVIYDCVVVNFSDAAKSHTCRLLTCIVQALRRRVEQLELLNSDKDETIKRHDVIVAGMTRSVTSLEASLAASRDLLADKERALAAKIKELESKAEQCERAERQLDASAQELRRTRASLVRAEESASEKERALNERSRRAVELEADNEDLRTRAANLSSRLEETTVQLTGARSDRNQLHGELARCARSVEQLRAELRASHALAARRSCERGGRGSDVQGHVNDDHVSTVAPAQLTVVNAAAKRFDVHVKHEKSSLRGGDVSPALLTRRPIADRQRHSPPDDRQVS